MASDYTFYVDPPVDLPANQRQAWLDRLASALAGSDKLEMAVVDSPGGAWTWDASAEQLANCKTKVVVVVNGRPCGPKLLDPVQLSKLTKFKKDDDAPIGTDPVDESREPPESADA
jgi:hypothetical protein